MTSTLGVTPGSKLASLLGPPRPHQSTLRDMPLELPSASQRLAPARNERHPARSRWTAAPSRRTLDTAFALAAAFTAFDALASYVGVATLNVASEMNPALAALAAVIGFGPTMAVRAAAGLLVLGLLWMIARSPHQARLRSHARAAGAAGRGVVLVAIAFGAIAIYHLAGLAYSLWLAPIA